MRGREPKIVARCHIESFVMPGERHARGKGIYSAKKMLNLHEIDSLPLRDVPSLGRE
jgi:hypothetical protein